MIQESWLLYTNWLKAKLPKYSELLNSGASDGTIEKLESYLQLKLPEDFKTLYRLNDGDKSNITPDTFVGTFFGFEFFPIDRIISIHEEWKQNDNDDYDGTSFPEKHVKINYTNPNWIPIFGDSGGNYIGLDLDPDSEGSIGQIINFGRDEDNKFVAGKSLNNFLEFLSAKVQSGECDEAIVEEDDGGFSYGLTPQSHLIDDLKGIFGS